MIRGVLFDLDNTLVDFLRMKRLASAEAARAMVAAGANFPFDEEQAGAELFAHYLDHGIESDDAFRTFLEKHNRSRIAYGLSVQDRILAAGIQSYLRAKDLFLTPYPGVRRTLVELVRRGIRLGVVTDAPRLKGWQRLTQLGLAEFFDVVVAFDDTGSRKPDPAPFRAAVEALGLRPFEILFVGDWPERDVQGARALGLKTAFARYGRPHAGDGHGADAELEGLPDLIPLLDTLAKGIRT
jgi:putative hydrolase of the HAD superfamily